MPSLHRQALDETGAALDRAPAATPPPTGPVMEGGLVLPAAAMVPEPGGRPGVPAGSVRAGRTGPA